MNHFEAKQHAGLSILAVATLYTVYLSVLICFVNLQEVQKSQSLLASAEAELHHVKEKNMDLKRCNSLLEQEKLKVGI